MDRRRGTYPGTDGAVLATYRPLREAVWCGLISALLLISARGMAAGQVEPPTFREEERTGEERVEEPSSITLTPPDGFSFLFLLSPIEMKYQELGGVASQIRCKSRLGAGSHVGQAATV